QQGHAERQVAMHAQVGDADVGVVLQDKDQQEEQDYGEETHRHPDPAGPGALDPMLRQRRRGRCGRCGWRCGRFRRGLLGRGGLLGGTWGVIFRAGWDVGSSRLVGAGWGTVVIYCSPAFSSFVSKFLARVTRLYAIRRPVKAAWVK